MLSGMTATSNDKKDEEVWLRYVAGSDQALTQLVEKYHNRLIGFLSGHGCSDPLGITQDVWGKVVEKQSSFDGKSFSGWVFMIARNMLYEQHRKAARRQESNLSPEFDVEGSDEIVALQRLEQQEMVQIIKACMESVGEPFITAFRLKLDGAKAKEIAKQLGVTENTISTRVHRAKTKIKDCVEGKVS